MLGISCYAKCEYIRILYVLLQSIVGWSLIVNVEYYINGKYTMLWLKVNILEYCMFYYRALLDGV